MIIATRENSYLLLEMDNVANSFTEEFLDELEMWLDRAESDRTVHSIILTSNTKIFSVGGNLEEMQYGVDKGDSADYVKRIVPKINKIIFKMITHKLPIITILNGTAAGGGINLFLAGDIRYATNRGKLYSAFADLALSPDSGSTILVPKRFSDQIAFEFLTLPISIDATYLLDQKVVKEVGEFDDILKKAKLKALEYEKIDSWSLARTKQLANKSLISTLEENLTDEYNSIVEACLRENFTTKLKEVRDRLSKK
jgi:enoyl-CoA hydratase/carnithine racemase